MAKYFRISNFEFRISKSGFTLAELMVSVTVLALLITFATAFYFNFFQSFRNVKASNLVYEEARLAMNRIVKEVRNGTIDYEEYHNQNKIPKGTAVNETFGRNYCDYSLQFYSYGQDGEPETADDEHIGIRNENVSPAIKNSIQKDLYLIDINGTHRTYIKRIVKKDELGNTVGKIGLIKLIGRDYGVDHIKANDVCSMDAGEQDGRIDTWECDTNLGFECEKEELSLIGGCTGERDIILEDKKDPTNNSFIDITPEALDIIDLKFIVSPSDDPRKAYNMEEVQIQPNITIKMI